MPRFPSPGAVSAFFTERRAFQAVLAAGVLLHLASIPLLGLNPLESDAKQFNDEADAILDGRGWINTEGPGLATTTYPTQVVFLLVCKLVAGRDNVLVPVILQHAFVVLTALLARRMALRLGLTGGVANGAMGIVLFFPHMLYLSNVLISHTLGMLLAVLGVEALVSPRAQRPGHAFLTGIVWGAATLARFTFQYFVPLYVLARVGQELWRTRRIARGTAVRMALLALGFALVLGPWMARVRAAEGGGGGYTDAWRICYTFNRAPELRGNQRDAFQHELLADENLSGARREAAYRDKVFENLRRHPEWFINNWLTNTSYLLINVSVDEQPHRAIYTGIIYSMLLGFGLVGLAGITAGQHALLLPAYLLAVVVFAVHVPIYGYLANAFPVWACFTPVVAHGIRLSFVGARQWRRGVAQP